MQWLVNDVFRQDKSSHYMLDLHADSLRVIAKATSRFPVKAGDVWYPVENAMYLINKKETKRLKANRASPYSSVQWHSLLNSRNREPA